MNNLASILRRLFTHRFARAGALLAMALLVAGCHPSVDSITSTSATLYAIDDNQDIQSLPAPTVTFEYGLDNTYQSGSGQGTLGGPGNYASFNVQGLKPATMYHWHYTYTDQNGTPVDSGDQTFTTDLPTFVVNTTADTDAVNAGDGTAADANGKISLRSAMEEIEAEAMGGKIIFDSTVFASAQTITLTSSLPEIEYNTTIIGPGANLLTVDAGNNSYIIFDVGGGTSSTISGLTVSNTKSGGYAFYSNEASSSTLTIDHCHMVNNYYGIYVSGGTVNATNCTITGGASSYYGIYNDDIVSLTNCFIGDQGNGGGYGIAHYGTLLTMNKCLMTGSYYTLYVDYPMTATNCTITGTKYYATYISADATFTNCTISNNPSYYGLYTFRGTTTLTNTIVSGNGYDYVANLSNTSGHNILTYINDDPDPQLSPLADNGGPTQTMALQAGSSAIDAGDPNSTLLEDQRGYIRPADGDGNGTKIIDIGAYEYGAYPPGTIVVDSTADTVADDGVTTLREAVTTADANPGSSIIFDPTVFATAKTITLTGGDLDITAATTITGPKAGVTVDGNQASRIFTIDAGANDTVTITGLTITHGNAAATTSGVRDGEGGGAVVNGGTLVLQSCSVVNNSSTTDAGGGLANFGALTLIDSTVANNSTQSYGGGIYTDYPVTMTNCTISGNHADNPTINFGSAGGIDSYSDSDMLISNCTITGNTCASTSGAGGVYSSRGNVYTVSDSIIAGNTGTNGSNADITGNFTSGGYNLIGDGTGAPAFSDGVNGDQVGTTASPIDPKLDPNGLQYNGGPTQTIALESNSTAIDAGDPASTLATDQRGYTRVNTIDIGAYEFNGIPPGTYIVNSTADTVADDGVTTLREAITAAVAFGSDAKIIFDPTVFATAQTITLSGTELPVFNGSASIVITGPSAGLTVDGNDASRIFEVASGTVVISKLTINGGHSTSSNGYTGGGIFQTGGTLTLNYCSITNNKSDTSGGGITENAGTLFMNDCTISGNSTTVSGYNGGGGYLIGTATLTNCTIANNSADASGGCYAATGVTFNSCTVTGNQAVASATYGGGGLGGAFSLNNTIVAGNTATDGVGPDIKSYGTNGGDYNLIQDTTDATLSGTHNITGQDPKLDANGLQNNGGPTQTIALQSGSPAIDAGDPNGTLKTDQRRYGRPVNAIIDIGAYEFGASATPQIVISGRGQDIANGDTTPSPTDGTDFGSVVVGSSAVQHTFTITNNGEGTLHLTGSPNKVQTGSDAFSPTSQPSSPVSPGGSTTFTISFSPSNGLQTATITVANDDPEVSPYTFAVTGTGVTSKPTITTPTSNVTGTSVTLGGDVTSDGGATISSRGVVYAKTADDATPKDGDTNSHTVTTTGTTGVFTVNASGLAPNTGYSFTAFATNSNGTSYTSAGTFTTGNSVTTGVIAAKGQAVDGEPAGTTYYSFGIPSINADGATACTVKMKVGKVIVSAIVAGTPPEVVVRAGDAAPGTTSKFVKFDDVLLDAAGEIAFPATISGGTGTTTSSNNGIWSNRGGILALVARENAAAPGVAGGKFGTFTSVAITDGTIAFTATTRGVTGNGLWIDTGSGPVLALHSGGTLPIGQATKTIKSFVALSALKETAGQGNGVAMVTSGQTTLAQVVATIEFTDGSSSVVALHSDGSVDEVASKGGTAPGSTATFTSFSGQTQSTDGRAAFVSVLSNSKPSIFVEDDTFALGEVVAAGDTAAGAGTATFHVLSDPVNNDQGDIAWKATLSGATSMTQVGIWWRHAGDISLVAQTGKPAAGTTGMFLTLDALALSSGTDGAPIFLGKLRAGGGVNSANNHGLWAVDAAGQARLLLRTGSTIDLGGSTTPVVKSFTVLSVVPASSSQTRGYASGAVIVRVAYPGAAGDALVTLPIPAPAQH